MYHKVNLKIPQLLRETKHMGITAAGSVTHSLEIS